MKNTDNQKQSNLKNKKRFYKFDSIQKNQQLKVLQQKHAIDMLTNN